MSDEELPVEIEVEEEESEDPDLEELEEEEEEEEAEVEENEELKVTACVNLNPLAHFNISDQEFNNIKQILTESQLRTLYVKLWKTPGATFCLQDAQDIVEPEGIDPIQQIDDILTLPEIDAPALIVCPVKTCRSPMIEFTSKQTRSADEPETKFCRCTKCGAQWKI